MKTILFRFSLSFFVKVHQAYEALWIAAHLPASKYKVKYSTSWLPKGPRVRCGAETGLKATAHWECGTGPGLYKSLLSVLLRREPWADEEGQDKRMAELSKCRLTPSM